MIIRKACTKDIAAITSIYNWAIENTTATFDTELKTDSDMQIWLENHDSQHPVIIAEVDDKVVGWGAINKWSDRSAYDGCGELSFYIDPKHQGLGIGTKIFDKIIELGRELNYLTLISRITSESDSSLYIHRKKGFRDIGVIKSAGVKFQRILDVNLLQLVY